MEKLLFHCPNPADATAWYRVLGPLGGLKKQFDMMPIEQASMASAHLASIAFFQRPNTYKEVDAMRMFRRANVPVVIDYDDDTLSVPTDNPHFFHYANADLRNATLYAMQEADAVIVSTSALRDAVKRIYPEQRVYVVPNALNPNFHRDQIEPKNDTFLWRGCAGHQLDLMTYRDEFFHFAEQNPERKFTFFGYYPWFLEKGIPRKQFQVEKFQDSIANYLVRMSEIAPRFGVIPLFDSGFNRCKSNIAWLEMTWAGAACLVPEWPEWTMPGTITYKDQESFLAGLKALSSASPELLDQMRKDAWAHIQANFMLPAVNPLRAAIFNAAMGKIEWPKETPINGPKESKPQ